MAEQKSNVFVSLLKKSVGIKENASGCCGTENLAGASTATTSSDCCGAEGSTTTSCCDSDKAQSGSCC